MHHVKRLAMTYSVRRSNRRTCVLRVLQCVLALCTASGLTGIDATAANNDQATLVVAAHNAAQQSRAQANFVCDGVGDQEEINAAIGALPEAGGRVQLSEGTFDIRKVNDTLGGVIIDRSDVVLSGQGTSTRLVQAAAQNTNVIRIIGSGVGQITIRDLWVDANREENADGKGDPNVSHGRFEFCGIKAFYTYPGGPSGERNHHITIQHCHVHNSHRLGIMLEGPHMKVINNVLGNAGSDAVEILTGPGEIRGNSVEITGRTHVAIGSDRGNSILMTDNIVRVLAGGNLDIGFRSWAQSRRHVIANNILTVEPGGRCTLAMDVRGTGAVVSGNDIHTENADQPLRLSITGGNTLVTGNLLENVIVEINDQTGEDRPIVVRDNILENSRIDHQHGTLVTPDGQSSR
jgi:hypothetical protein